MAKGKYECPKHGVVYPQDRLVSAMKAGQFECVCPQCGEAAKALPTDEQSAVSPLSVYGLTKYFQENIMKTVCASLNITYTALRFQNVYGPGQSLVNPYTGIISIFSNRLKEGKDIFIFEDGKESRDFVFITDVVESLYLSTLLNDGKGRILNVGTGIMTTVMEVAQTLKKIINSSSNINHNRAISQRRYTP
jgi:dTDP-L-rhamnose 4-epimerase